MAMKSKLIGKFVVCRCESAGVHAGILDEKVGMEARLTDACRVYSWTKSADNNGACSLLAETGPGPGSKIARHSGMIEIAGVCEVLECSPAAEFTLRSGKW